MTMSRDNRDKSEPPITLKAVADHLHLRRVWLELLDRIIDRYAENHNVFPFVAILLLQLDQGRHDVRAGRVLRGPARPPADRRRRDRRMAPRVARRERQSLLVPGLPGLPRGGGRIRRRSPPRHRVHRPQRRR